MANRKQRQRPRRNYITVASVMTLAEAEAVQRAAKLSGMTISRYVRWVLASVVSERWAVQRPRS